MRAPRSMKLTRQQVDLLGEYARHFPRNADELHRFVARDLGVVVPRTPLIPGNNAPFDYLVHAFFAGVRDDAGVVAGALPGVERPGAGALPGVELPGAELPGDVVVWANRGGGKTFLGAVATLLDMLFKPGIRVCILGGSLEQSGRMFSHLLQLLDRPVVRPMLAREPTQRRVVLLNQSRVHLLCQSERSVRGIRVQRLRCDEVETFEPHVWEAAQYVTKTATCGKVTVRGGIEAMSTMHQPYGLMSKLVERATSNLNARVLRWSALDVAARCEPQRPCESCVLWNDCLGRAKEASGFLAIDDLVAQYGRNGEDRWSAEMMCRRPSAANQVYPKFDATPGRGTVIADGPDAPGHAAQTSSIPGRASILIAGMDFGLRNPLAMVWAMVTPIGSDPLRWPVHVFDEYTDKGLVLDEHLARIAARGHPTPAWIGVDPAGRAANSQTGKSDVQCLIDRGYRVRARASELKLGLAIVARRLDTRTLTIAARCTQLTAALAQYHYDPRRPESEAPVKDGPDHLCDALRYMLICLEHGAATVQAASY